MKKRLFCLLLAVLLCAAFGIPAMAIVEYGVIYDETDALGTERLVALGEEVLPQTAAEYGVDLRVDIFTSLDNPDGIRASAAYVYENYGYGMGETREGVSLTLIAEPDDTGWTVSNWCVYAAGGDASANSRREKTVAAAVEPYLSDESWSGDLARDQETIANIAQAMVQGLETAFTAPAEPEFGGFIYDEAALLTPEQEAQLEATAQRIADAHNCGVYVITVEDFWCYGLGDVYETTYGLYHENNLGVGPERNGATLLLSMADRDYATFFYGEFTEYAFNAYGQEAMEEEFLDNLSENDWYGGFSDFMAVCDEYLTLAEAGDPVRFKPSAAIGAGFFMALPLAAIICLIVRKATMKSVKIAKEASQYVLGKGLYLTERWDNYTHTTVTTRKLKKESSVARSGGGGSGRSGKF